MDPKTIPRLLFGDFSSPETIGIYYDLIRVSGLIQNARDGLATEHAITNDSAKRLTSGLFESIRSQNPSFIEKLLACFRLLNGGHSETQFSNKHSIPSEIKRDALIAYFIINETLQQPPGLNEIEIHIAWQRCRDKDHSAGVPQLSNVRKVFERKAVKNGIRLETRQGIRDVIKELFLPLSHDKSGPRKKGTDLVREVLDRLHLPYQTDSPTTLR